MISLDPYSESSFEVIGSNTSLVTNYGTTTGTVYSRYFGLDPLSNVGYIIGSSNRSFSSDPLFVIGKIANDSLLVSPDIVLHNNNVGIGTVIPSTRLHVEGDARIFGTITTSNLVVLGDAITPVYSDSLLVENDGSDKAVTVRQFGSNSIAEFYKGTSPVLILSEFGNIGVGSTQPTSQFQVTKKATLNSVKTSYIEADVNVNGDNAIVTLGSMNVGGSLVATSFDIVGGASISMSETNGAIQSIGYIPSTEARFRVTNSGNVGIGVTNPMSKLQVAGDLLPGACNTYNLGSSNLRWKDLFLSGTTIDIEGIQITKTAENQLSVQAPSVSANAPTRLIVQEVQLGSASSPASNNVILRTNAEKPGTVQIVTLTSEGATKNQIDLDNSTVWSNVGSDVILLHSNVGIGTIAPRGALDVAGDLYVSNTIYSDQFLPDRLVYAGSSCNLRTHPVTVQQLHYLSNITSDVQTQLDQKVSIVGGTISGSVSFETGLTVTSGASVTSLQSASTQTSNLIIQSSNASQAGVLVQKYSGSVAEFYDMTKSTSTPSLVISSGGNVGLGTTYARKTLDIEGDINFTGTLFQSNALFKGSQWDTQEATYNIYYTTGSVGIGTSLPQSALHVHGTIRNTTLTSNRVIVTDGSKNYVSSDITTTQIGYIGNVTSDIQAQLDTKQSNIFGAASTITSSNLTLSRALVSDALGKVAVSSVSSDELGYLAGVTSAVQTQLNQKLSLEGGAVSGDVTVRGTFTTSNLNVLGTTSVVNSIVTQHSNVTILNTSGAGPALVVSQTGNGMEYAIAEFYDPDVSETIPAFKIQEGGNVGIATTVAGSFLSVAGNASIGSNYAHIAAPLHGVIIQGNVGIGTFAPLAKTHIVHTGSGDILRVEDENADTSSFVINQDGFVGIGTHTATDLVTLNVPGASSVYGIRFMENSSSLNGAFVQYNSGASYLELGSLDNNTSQGGIYITKQGADVGIGTTSPSQKLHVQGDTFVTGNIGIGTSTPTHKLHVYASSSTDNNYEATGILLENAQNGEVGLAIRNNIVAANGKAWVFGINSNQSRLDIAYGNQANQLSDESAKWTILTDGNVGIGKTVPSQALDVAGSVRTNSVRLNASDGNTYASLSVSNSNLVLENTANADMTFKYNAGTMRFDELSSGQTRMVLTSSGNLGIGTTAPSHRLHIFGNNQNENEYESAGVLLENAGYGETALAIRSASTGTDAWVIGLNSNQTRLDIGYGSQTSQMDASSADVSVLIDGNVGIGTTLPLQKLHVPDNVLLGKGSSSSASATTSTAGGPFFKQRGWGSSGASHTISYPNYCQGDNSGGTLHIQVSNKSNTSGSKIGNLTLSFIKRATQPVDIFLISTHTSSTLITCSVTSDGNSDIIVATDNDCCVSWTSIGAF